jgi:hypothetical protein
MDLMTFSPSIWIGYGEYNTKTLMYEQKQKEDRGERTLYSGLTFKAGTLFFLGTFLAALSSLS